MGQDCSFGRIFSPRFEAPLLSQNEHLAVTGATLTGAYDDRQFRVRPLPPAGPGSPGDRSAGKNKKPALSESWTKSALPESGNFTILPLSPESDGTPGTSGGEEPPGKEDPGLDAPCHPVK